jgi:hypothetical protein
MNCAHCGGINPDGAATQCGYCQRHLPNAAQSPAAAPWHGAAGPGAAQQGYGSAAGAPFTHAAGPYAPPHPGHPGYPGYPAQHGYPAQPGAVPVQAFGGGYGPPVNVAKSHGFWSTFSGVLGIMNLIRIAIVVLILGAVGLSACISALSDHM